MRLRLRLRLGLGLDGPYPYAVGMLQVLSLKVASWMVEQEEFAEFERRATAATRYPLARVRVG